MVNTFMYERSQRQTSHLVRIFFLAAITFGAQYINLASSTKHRVFVVGDIHGQSFALQYETFSSENALVLMTPQDASGRERLPL